MILVLEMLGGMAWDEKCWYRKPRTCMICEPRWHGTRKEKEVNGALSKEASCLLRIL